MRLLRRTLELALIVAGLVTWTARSAEANTIYQYTGNPFTSFVSPYTSGDALSLSFALASPLADNLSNQAITPISFSFSDGVQTLTNLNTAGNQFVVFTDASGNINHWSMTVETPDQFNDIITANFPGNVIDQAKVLVSSSFRIASNSNTPGSWTLVPEPSTLMLCSSSLLILAVAARKRQLFDY